MYRCSEKNKEHTKMIAIIRIRGKVDVPKDVESTLDKLKLRRKYACVVVREKPEIKGMLKRVRNFVAYGKIDERTFVELVEKRGRSIGKEKKDAKKIVSAFIESKTGEKLEKFGIKPFFRLHPPRGGIKSKLHYPKGVLGDHGEKINELIRRML
jgi:large subunit ribosomal protein L30